MTELPTLSGKTKDELLAIAADEQVDLAGATNNPDRIAAIEAARLAKAAAAASGSDTGTGDSAADAGQQQNTGDQANADDDEDEDEVEISPDAFFVRTVRKAPRRRAGLAFGPEKRTVLPTDFPEDIGPANGMLALLEDPALRCTYVDPEGVEHAFDPEEVERLRAVIAARIGDD